MLGEPHTYAGDARWATVMVEQAVPLLPARWRAEALRRVDAALALLDWDLAQPFDPAVDAACLAWHGWDAVRDAVAPQSYDRARIWYATFGIEQVASALPAGEPAEIMDEYVAATVGWLERTCHS